METDSNFRLHPILAPVSEASPCQSLLDRSLQLSRRGLNLGRDILRLDGGYRCAGCGFVRGEFREARIEARSPAAHDSNYRGVISSCRQGVNSGCRLTRALDHRGRARRWTDHVAGLVEAQVEYAAWLDSLPDSLQDSATAEALRAICDLDLTELQAIQPPRGFGRD